MSDTPAAPPPALRIRHLRKSFAGVEAVRDISLQLDGPQAVAILGPNGAGKSTLMRLIAGYYPPDSGTMELFGEELSNGREGARRRLGYLPENAPAFESFRVRECLAFVGNMHGLHGKDLKEAMEETMERCSLTAVATRIAGQLSKGYRHRLGLAMALLHRPGLLLLDEPTDGLDPEQKREARELFRQISRECTLLVSTHILEEVPYFCQRVLFLRGGQIVYDGEVPASLEESFLAATRGGDAE